MLVNVFRIARKISSCTDKKNIQGCHTVLVMPKRRNEAIIEVSDLESKRKKKPVTRTKSSKKCKLDIPTAKMGCLSSKNLEKDEINYEETRVTVQEENHDHIDKAKLLNKSHVQPIHEKNSQSTKNSNEWNHVDYILELNTINRSVAETVVEFFNNDNTIPFIARYRKNQTGGLDAEQLRAIKECYDRVKVIKSKAETVIKSIEKAGKLTPELENTVKSMMSLNGLEHIHSMYKAGGKKTLAERARDVGLGPIAEAIIHSIRVPLTKTLINPKVEGLQDEEHIKNGIVSILSDIICKEKRTFDKIYELRRKTLMQMQTKKTKEADSLDASKQKENDNKYSMYYDWSCSEKYIKPHQILAISRAEAQKVITAQIIVPNEFEIMLKKNILQFHEHAMSKSPFHRVLIMNAFQQAYKKSLKPMVIRLVRNEMNETAQQVSMEIFAVNVRQLLLTQPVRGKVVIGIDPGFLHGCKLAVVSEQGDVLETTIIYPHRKGGNYRQQAADILVSLVHKHKCSILALGNATACRETELFISDLIKSKMFGKHGVTYAIVNEAGTSVYSCGKEAKSEFPNMDCNVISAVSIARRLQDPLAELVKVEPKCLGVGMYQHDLPTKQLMIKLNECVSEVVSFVGVDINTASQCLLRRVAGLSESKAMNIIQWRRKNGPFISRDQLRQVKGIGAKTFEQCAGFIRIIPETALSKSTHQLKTTAKDHFNYLDQTWIHPESYKVANVFVDACKVDLKDFGSREFICKIKMYASEGYVTLAQRFQTTADVLKIIVEGLTVAKGEDIRTQGNAPLFRKSLRTMDDLIVDSLLSGEVRNVTAFGAFVDVGVEKDGLIHISALEGEILRIGQRVEVKVREVDRERGRLSLLLIQSY